jgi:hypothetical protein
MSAWISVKERLPQPGQAVISYSEKAAYKIAITIYEEIQNQQYFWSYLSSGCGCCDDCQEGVTHWMMLPERPKTFVKFSNCSSILNDGLVNIKIDNNSVN